ncbi:hypothetical protein INT43_003938 [Umbelopsis isabellina]|uniref:Protein kinase domain-containing protein n=1 Tax=Mortierella isabellina TaxID=91625 RepID=A0A8H7PUT9_MORIS|nr:hypothetical protein INT43_003938 [Umbelopsis isabellina]
MPLKGVTEQFRGRFLKRQSTNISKTSLDQPPPKPPPKSQDHYSQPDDKHRSDAKKKEQASKDKTAATVQLGTNTDALLRGIGDYEFLSSLGTGKFSRVVLAKHIVSCQPYAIKIIDKRLHDYRVMSRLVREISLMELLSHENVVKLYETFETAESLFLVLEYIPGVNLDEHLQRSGGSLSESEARAIFRQMVTAVSYCHSRWVVHRDLKTPNVLLRPDGVIKLADFGLGNRYGLQRLKTICGSMLYYSPEIISAQKYTGPEVDCWCLGISLFRMTAGFEPFSHAHTVGELKKDVLNGNFPMPAQLSPDLQVTIRKCLNIDRKQRMSIKQALKGDPWLNNYGKLPDPIIRSPSSNLEDMSDLDDNTSSRSEMEKRTRRQFIKDLEEEKHRGYRVKRTIVYHPITTSTYFTTPLPHHQKPEENARNQELLRADILQEIRTKCRRLGVRQTDNASNNETRLPFRLFSKLTLRKPQHEVEGALAHNGSLRRSGSSLLLTKFSPRLNKDHHYYFTIQAVHGLSSTTAVSSSSGSTFSNLDSNVPSSPAFAHTTSLEIQRLDEREMMNLVKSACELLGVTYFCEDEDRLSCILALKSRSSQEHAQSGSSSILPKSSLPNSPSSPTLVNNAGYIENRSSMDKSSEQGSQKWGKLRKRLSLPLGHINLMQSSYASSAVGSTHGTIDSATGKATKKHESSQFTATPPSKEGSALFTIEVFSVPNNNGKRVIALRFTKTKGSNKVFKLASGWIGGVLGASANSRT